MKKPSNFVNVPHQSSFANIKSKFTKKIKSTKFSKHLFILSILIVAGTFPLTYSQNQVMAGGVCAADDLIPRITDHEGMVLIATCGPDRNFDFLFRAAGGLFLGLFFLSFAVYSYFKQWELGFMASIGISSYQFAQLFLNTNAGYVLNSNVIGYYFVLAAAAGMALWVTHEILIKYPITKKHSTLIPKIFLIVFGTVIFCFTLTYVIYPIDSTPGLWGIPIASSVLIIFIIRDRNKPRISSKISTTNYNNIIYIISNSNFYNLPSSIPHPRAFDTPFNASTKSS